MNKEERISYLRSILGKKGYEVTKLIEAYPVLNNIDLQEDFIKVLNTPIKNMTELERIETIDAETCAIPMKIEESKEHKKRNNSESSISDVIEDSDEVDSLIEEYTSSFDKQLHEFFNVNDKGVYEPIMIKIAKGDNIISIPKYRLIKSSKVEIKKENIKIYSEYPIFRIDDL